MPTVMPNSLIMGGRDRSNHKQSDDYLPTYEDLQRGMSDIDSDYIQNHPLMRQGRGDRNKKNKRKKKYDPSIDEDIFDDGMGLGLHGNIGGKKKNKRVKLRKEKKQKFRCKNRLFTHDDIVRDERKADEKSQIQDAILSDEMGQSSDEQSLYDEDLKIKLCTKPKKSFSKIFNATEMFKQDHGLFDDTPNVSKQKGSLVNGKLAQE